jgi:hypothetical protein
VLPRIENVSYLGCVEVEDRESSRVLVRPIEEPSVPQREHLQPTSTGVLAYDTSLVGRSVGQYGVCPPVAP